MQVNLEKMECHSKVRENNKETSTRKGEGKARLVCFKRTSRQDVKVSLVTITEDGKCIKLQPSMEESNDQQQILKREFLRFIGE